MLREDRLESLQTFWIFLSCLHEHIQRLAFSNMGKEPKYNLVRGLLERDREYASHSSQMMESTMTNQSSIVAFEKLIGQSQEFLEDDDNFKFLRVDNPKIGCENLELYKDANHGLVDTEKATITPLHKVHFANKSFSSGSCLTCTRDINKHDVQNEITVLKYNNLSRPKCVFYPAENRNKMEVNIALTAMENEGIVYLTNVEVVSTSEIKMKMKNNMKRRGISEEMFSKMFNRWRIDDRLRDSWIKISGLDQTFRENTGVFATMERRGYSPLIQPKNNKRLMGIPKIIHILSVVLSVVCSGWNPLRLCDLSNVMHRSNFDQNLMERIRTSVPISADATKYYWPLKKIALSPITLEHLLSNAQTIKFVNPSIRINQFVEDSDMEHTAAKLYLDKIALWRC
jgi:hypothetical protein